ncbi:MAG: DUF4402 domain-containing protein [Ignavibacteria bacterium]|nr:DUF4402 domain-containing protein [Ignavibacteria bacterium]
MLLLLPINFASAQIYSSSANASVNMIKPLSIVSISNRVNFGEIILTGSAFSRNLSPSSGAIFRIEGHPNRNVIISYSHTNLSNSVWVSQNGGTIGSLVYTPDVVHTGSNSSYTNPISVRSGSSYQLVNSNGIGILYLWIGGRLDISANQPVGDYEGTINITVSY